MRQGQQNRRGRGRGNQQQNRKGQHHHNPLMRTYQSNGPDQKIHGTPAQIAEKYMSLARDALSSGDHVLAENYLQHAEHYNRIILTYREQQIQQSGGEGMNGGLPRHRPFQVAGEPFDGETGEDGEDTGSEQPQMGMRANEPQPRMFESGQSREDRPQRQGGDQGYRDQGAPRDRDRDGGGRDREYRDGGRNFRQRDQRFSHDRGDRGQPDSRERHERFPRGEANGERHERFDRGDRQDRGPRPAYGDRQDRGERFDRGDRGDRQERFERTERPDRPERQERQERPERPERTERPERSDRPDMGERPIAVGGGEVDRAVEPAAPAAEAPPPAAPRRRERFVDAASDQPEFLRRPVRRPRRDTSATESTDAAPPAARPVAPETPSGD